MEEWKKNGYYTMKDGTKSSTLNKKTVDPDSDEEVEVIKKKSSKKRQQQKKQIEAKTSKS